MAAADDDTLQYYFGDNRTFMYNEFSNKDSIFGDSRSGRRFVGADGHDLRLKTDLALVPSKLLELMMDPKVPPQNAHFDFLDEVNREEFEQVSGEASKVPNRCIPILVPLTKTMRTWGVKLRMR